MDLMGLLTGSREDGVLYVISKDSGVSLDQVEALTGVALPALIEQISRNAQSKEGLTSLSKALDQHSNSDLSDLAGFLKGVDKEDGSKILEHVFSDKNDSVQQSLAKSAGINAKQVTTILSMLAPLVLGTMGNQKKKKNLDTAGVGDLAGQLAKSLGSNQSLLGMALKLLDGGGDSSLDLMGMLGKFLK